MPASDSLPPLREVVRKYGLLAKKSLGQNFLFDLNLTGRIARAAGPLDEATIVEIGPGPGGLTRALIAEGARKVIAIERDERCVAALGEIAAVYPGRLNVIAGDALDDRLRRSRARTCAGRSSARLRQSSLQYRHRAARALDRNRTMAALVRSIDADVPARGRRAHCCDTGGSRQLRAACRTLRLAHAGAHAVRCAGARLHAAAEGRIRRW